MKKVYGVLIGIVLIGGIAAPVQAQNEIGGLVRDEYALGLTPTIKSAGMGGAYVGVEGTQSMNPAALSIVDFMEVSLTYGNYNHDDGPMAHRGRLDATLPVPYFGGAARLMIDGFASEDEEEIRNGAPIEFDSFTLGGQYGRNITDWWAVGIGGYPYEKAQVDFGVGPVAGPVADPGPDIKGEALSQLGSIQLGTLFRPCDKVRIGGQIIYIIDDLEASFPGGGAHSGDYFDIHYFAIEYVP